MDKILIIDGNSVLYRAFYALNIERFKLDNNIYTNAIFGFMKIFFNKNLKIESYTNVIVAFDKGKKTFRSKIYQDYKATRKAMPKELVPQIGIIKEFLDSINVSYFEKDNFEADDIAGSLTTKFKDYKIDLLTSDKDYLQLVNSNTNVIFMKKGISETINYNLNNFYELTSLTSPAQIIDLKILSGDKSDNISSIKGISENTAIILLTIFNDIKNMFEEMDIFEEKLTDYKVKYKKRINPLKIKNILLENKENIFSRYELITIKKDLDYENVNIKKINIKNKLLLSFCKKYALNSFIKSLDLLQFDSDKKLAINNSQVINKWKDTYNDIDNYMVLEIYDENYHTSDALGFAILNNKGSFYFPFEEAIKDEKFLHFLTSEKYHKNLYNAKAIIVLLNRFNIKIEGIVYDLMLAFYILFPDYENNFSIIAEKLLDKIFEIDEEIYGKGVNKAIPELSSISKFSLTKALIIKNTYEKVNNLLEEKQQKFLYENIEFPLLFSLAKMEIIGVKVDVKELDKQYKELESLIKILQESIARKIGSDYNVNSPKQISELVYDKLKLLKPTKKRTVSFETLDKIRHKNEIISEILNYRKYQKLFSTYVKGIQKYVDKNDTIHTIYKQNYVVTGRLSSMQPNMQNIASNNIEQRKIKKIFITHNNKNIFVSFDYSQIELKILAQFSGDKALIDSFNNNEDIHSTTAKRLFNLKSNQKETDQQRRVAKAVNFGLIYGITDFGLSKNLKMGREKAKSIINKYFEIHGNVKKYMDDQIAFCKENNYLKNIFNRRREINFATDTKRNSRIATNMAIQSSAADILKIAINNIDKKLKKLKLKSQIILQIHDELIFEVPKNEINIIKKIIPNLMENIKEINDWKVKLKVNYKEGKNLFEL